MKSRNALRWKLSAEASGYAPTEDPHATIERLEAKVAKLTKINTALINWVERSTDRQGNSFSLFQTAILLEKQVHERTAELNQALRKLERSNRDLILAKEEAETARMRLSEAIESLSEGFVLFDADDRLVLFNSKFRALFPGMADLIRPGIKFVDYLRAAVARNIVLLPGEDGEAWVRRRLAQHRNPGAPVLQAMADGRWLQTSERRTKSGGTVGIDIDVTEIKRFEKRRRKRELEEKSRQLTATLDNLVQGVSVFDSDHRLAYWNKPFLSLLGLPPEFVKEKMPFERIQGYEALRNNFPDTDLNADLIKWTRSDSRHRPFRAEYRRRDGVVVEVQRNAMPDGGFVSTYTDTTQRHQAERMLEDAKQNLERRVAERTAELTELNVQLRLAKAAADKANLSKTKFLAAASHDLLQPLNAARLFVSALPDSDIAPSARHLIERTDTALESVDELLKALFDISKFDSGIISPEWRDFSMEGLLKALAYEYTVLAERKGLSLDVVPCTAVIRSDMLLLRRILQNFISNAIRYTAQGRVLLGCRRKAKFLSIEVWDTGPGIPEEHRESIFDEFQRFASNDTRGEQGFGLGLAIAQRSAGVLGIPLRVRSVVGYGSVFSAEVPYGETAAHEITDLQALVPQSYGLGNATVVFIENDETNLEAMTALLAKWSCRVIPAHDIFEALRLVEFEGATPDLVIADYHLDDGLTGLDAIAELRTRFDLPLPGIVVTADHTAQAQDAAQRAGYELLQKPIKPAELRSLISHLLT